MKNQKLFVGCLLVGMMVMGLGALNGYGAEDSIKIGAILSQTGTMAYSGQEAQKSLELAVEQVNAKGGIKGKKVALTVENTNTEPERSVSRALKLSEGDQVLAILGPDTAPQAFAVREQVAEPNKIVVISVTGSSPKLTEGNPRWYFRGATPAPYQCSSLVTYLVNKRGIKKLAILGDSGLMDQVDAFKIALKAFGLEPVGVELYKVGQTNFNGIMLAIKPKNPEGIIFVGYMTEAASAIKQARDLGIQAQFIGNTALVYPEFLKVGGMSVEGVIASTGFTAANQAKDVQDFVAAYKKKFPGFEPSQTGAQAYDQVNLVFDAMRNSNLTFETKNLAQDRQMIRDYLEQKVKNYDGVAANITYSEKDHTAYRTVNVLQVVNGKWKIIEPSGKNP